MMSGVEDDGAAGAERRQKEIGVLGEFKREDGRSRDGHESADARRYALLHELEAAPACHQHEAVLAVDSAGVEGADELIEGVVAADVFAHELDLAILRDPSCAM